MPEQQSCVWTIVQPLTPARHPILRSLCVHVRPFRSVDQLLRLMRSPNPVAEAGAGSPLLDQVEKAVRTVRNVASWAAATAADGQEEPEEADSDEDADAEAANENAAAAVGAEGADREEADADIDNVAAALLSRLAAAGLTFCGND